MKRKLVRYPLALLCLILAGYCFLRSPVPMWTMEGDARFLDFTLDGQSFWTYRKLEDFRYSLRLHDVLTGSIHTEHDIKDVWVKDMINGIRVSQDGRFALIDEASRMHSHVQTIYPVWLIEFATGKRQKIENPTEATYRFSPSSQYLIRLDATVARILRREGLEQLLQIDEEKDASGQRWLPDQAVFSPDETRLAALWTEVTYGAINGRSFRELNSGGEIRIYDTSQWNEVARSRLTEKCDWKLDKWDHTALRVWGREYLRGKETPGTIRTLANDYYYALHHAHSSSKPTEVQLMFLGYVHSRVEPNPFKEAYLGENWGNDWHAMRHHFYRNRPEWVEDLIKLPVFGFVINRLWPAATHHAEFYQTSTNTQLNTINTKPYDDIHVSPDGRWLIGKIKEPGSLVLYSTAPLIRWPGYLLVLAAILILFKVNVVRMLISLCHTPLVLRRGVVSRNKTPVAG